MNEIFITVLSVSFAGALLILLLCLLRPFYKERLSKRWQYYIWLAVIARLLLPFAPETNLTGTLFSKAEDAGRSAVMMYLGLETRYASKETAYGTQKGAVSADGAPERQADMDSTGQNSAGKGNKEAVESDPLLSILDSISQYLWFVWVAVALILLIRKITVYQSFVKYIGAGCSEVEDIYVLERFGKLVEESGIHSYVELSTNNLVSSPLLIGFFRPRIVLPTADVPDTDFEYTVLHELMHYKRLDMFYKWLAQFTVCVHWFNPLVCRMGREINRACELACDEAVIRKLDNKEQRAYGNTLLNAVGAGGSYKDSSACVTLGESKELLKERLDAIMRYRKESKMVVCVSMMMAAAILCGAAFTGAYGGASNKSAADGGSTSSSRTDSNGGTAGADSGEARHTGSITPAPDNLETKTARAEHFEQTDAPDLNITIENLAAVQLLPTSEKEVTVDYPDTLYKAEVENKNGDWNVSIAYIGSYSKYPSAVLYIPDRVYGNVKLQAEEATVECSGVFQNGGKIDADLKTSSVFYTIPDDFRGTLNVAVSSGYMELRSESGYRNCDIVISNCSSFGNIADGFTKRGDELTFTDGTKAGVVRIDMDNSGYATLE